jgi:hypothetical protein
MRKPCVQLHTSYQWYLQAFAVLQLAWKAWVAGRMPMLHA